MSVFLYMCILCISSQEVKVVACTYLATWQYSYYILYMNSSKIISHLLHSLTTISLRVFCKDCSIITTVIFAVNVVVLKAKHCYQRACDWLLSAGVASHRPINKYQINVNVNAYTENILSFTNVCLSSHPVSCLRDEVKCWSLIIYGSKWL